MLDSKQVDQLTILIKNSFRVHPNQDPVYVDVAGHLSRIAAKQHQILFGRRGSGKSCLLVHFHREAAKNDRVLSVYVNADDVKTLPYPDLLIRLLLSIGEGLNKRTTRWWQRLPIVGSSGLSKHLKELRSLLDKPEFTKVAEEEHRSKGGKAGGPELCFLAGACFPTAFDRY